MSFGSSVGEILDLVRIWRNLEELLVLCNIRARTAKTTEIPKSAFWNFSKSLFFCLALEYSPCWPSIRRYLGDYEPSYTSTPPKIHPEISKQWLLHLQQYPRIILNKSDDERRKLLSEWLFFLQRVILHCVLPIVLLTQVLHAWISIDEWPDGRRLLSTTWPWNVKIALVVLWGVCWMFIIYSTSDRDDGVEVSGYRYNGNELGHYSAQSLEVADHLWAHPGTGSELNSQFSSDDYQQTFFQSIMEDEAYSNLQLFAPEAVDETTGLISLGPSTVHTGFTPVGSSKSSGSPLHWSNMVRQLPQESLSPHHISVGMIANEAHNPSLATIARRIPNEMYCDHHDCASEPPMFLRRCDWKKHMDKHTRPYKCKEVGCEHLAGFGSKGDLVRHEKTHRQKIDPSLTYFCPFTGCKRSTGIGFSREDYLKDHVRKAHGTISRATEDHVETSAAERTTTVPELTGVNVSDTRRKRRREEDVETDGANSDLGTYQHLQSENKRLKRKLADSEAQNRMLERLLFDALKGESSTSQ